MDAVKKSEVKRKYYCYHGMTISIVWLTDEEYLEFIRKHWSSTLVRSTAYEREDDSGEPDEMHRPGADRAPAVHPGRERREGLADRAQALFKEG